MHGKSPSGRSLSDNTVSVSNPEACGLLLNLPILHFEAPLVNLNQILSYRKSVCLICLAFPLVCFDDYRLQKLDRHSKRVQMEGSFELMRQSAYNLAYLE